MRIRALLAGCCWRSPRSCSPARPRRRQAQRGRARGRGRDRPRRRGVHPHPRGGRRRRRLPGGAEPDPARDERDHLGRHLLPHPVRRPLRSSACPAHQEGHGRPHRADPRRPRRGRAGQGRGRAASWPSTRRQLADAKTRRPASSRRPARPPTSVRQRPAAPGPRPRWPSCATGPQADIEAAKVAGHGRPAGRGRRARRSSWPRRSSSATSTATPRPPLIESYINQVGSRQLS